MRLTAKFSVEITRTPKPEPEPEYVEVGEDEGSITTYPVRVDEPDEPALGFSLERSSW